MTPEELAACVEALVRIARLEGLSDEAILARIEEAADALREGPS